MTSTELEPAAPVAPAVIDETSWFDTTMRQAEVLAASKLVPEQYRKKPEDIVVAAMFGRDLGWSPTMALQHVHVVNGKPALSAQSMLALVRQAGHSVKGEKSIDGATVTGIRADTGDDETVTFGPEDQRRAGLNTEPWKKYPAAMFWARAVSSLCRSLFPDVLMGVSYTPDELHDIGPAATEPAPPPYGEALKETVRAKVLAAVEAGGVEAWQSWKADNPGWHQTDDGYLAASDELDRMLQSFTPADGDVVDGEIIDEGTD